jgi:hypothetical protein
MMKKSKIFVFALLMFSFVSLTFLPVDSAYAACPDGITSYWKLDEPTPGAPGGTYTDFIDDNDGTGAANPTAVAGRVNGAQQFDGFNDGIDVPPDRSFDWYSDESFSIEFWIKRNGAVAGNQVAIGRDDGNPATSLHWWVGILDGVTDTASFTLGDNDGGSITTVTGNTDLTDNDWHHVVAVRDRSLGVNGQNLLYVDGVLDIPAAVDAAYDAGFGSTSAVLNIGYLAGGFRFEDMLDEVALYDRALTAAEILNHYNNGIGRDYCGGDLPSDAPFPDDTISLWKLDEPNGPTYGDSFDENDGTGAFDPTAVAGIVNGAQQFDGFNDGIDVPPDRSFGWYNDESFSIEFWIKRNGAVAGNQVAIGRDDGNPATSLHWWVGILDGVTDTASFTLGDNNGGSIATATGNTDLTDNAWHHVVAVRDRSLGVNGQNLLYVDGVLDIPAAVDAAYDAGFESTSAVLNIGYLAGGDRFEDMLDEVALYDRALTAAEIKEHYDDGQLGRGIDYVGAGGGGGGGGGCFISTVAK